MSGYKVISLNDLIEQLGEERVDSILSSFSCPLNEDVEQFLRTKAMVFDNQSISRTHLVFASYKKELVLIAYFTLANKYFTVDPKILSSNLKRRVRKFSQFNSDLKRDIISAPLIAQLGKNFTNNYNDLITGDELLQIACDEVAEVQLRIGGKIVYLECEDKPCLIEYYERNGFRKFSERQLDNDSSKLMKTEYLVQMLRYM
ncbi:MAG: N-acetyltransferase [Clostridia bacterium]|nr:N-acetyltransferase [Clostridia bacterium]